MAAKSAEHFACDTKSVAGTNPSLLLILPVLEREVSPVSRAVILNQGIFQKGAIWC